MENLVELLAKLGGDGVLLGVLLWLAKGWVEVKILKPIEKLDKRQDEVEKKQNEATSQLKGAAFNITQRTVDMQQALVQETQKMANTFAQAASIAVDAQVKSAYAIEHTKVIEKEADQKMRNVGANLLGKIKTIEADQLKTRTEVQEIKKDVFYIKGKKDDSKN